MPRFNYRMTHTARDHLREAVRDTQKKWGQKQASRYNIAFFDGLQRLANNHHRLRSPHRDELVEGTDFSIHLIQHRYVAFQPHNPTTIIIAGIFHESMDIPTKLRELQQMARHEIDALRQEIGFSPSQNG
jgi:plasmid stabilization system protein ParE